MRTIREHISGIAKRVGQRFKRLARPAAGRVCGVLKRVWGGVRHRHVEEVRDCAPATAARCHASLAANPRGLPGGKTLSYRAKATDAVSGARVWARPSFQHQTWSPKAGPLRFDDLQAPPALAGRPLARVFRV